MLEQQEEEERDAAIRAALARGEKVVTIGYVSVADAEFKLLAEILGNIGPSAAAAVARLKLMIEHAREHHPASRLDYYGALARIEPEKRSHIEPILAAFDAPADKVPSRAIEQLSKLSVQYAKRLLPQLMEQMHDRRNPRQAAYLVARIEPANHRAMEVIAALIESSSFDRLTAITVLGEMMDLSPRAIAVLESQTESTDPFLRSAARQAPRKVRPEAGDD